MSTGDYLRWVFTIIPSFCVTHGILWSANGQLILETRSEDVSENGVPIPEKLPEGLWDWYNLKGDAVILILHSILGMSVLLLIELEIINLLDWCPRVSLRKSKSRSKEGHVFIKDDDVIAEEERVARQKTRFDTFESDEE